MFEYVQIFVISNGTNTKYYSNSTLILRKLFCKEKYGDIAGGGYIWHTTGSGKTLTSFKTARLASNLEFIDKVLFVVDRKDLDYQTMKEYDRFEKGAANSNCGCHQ